MFLVLKDSKSSIASCVMVESSNSMIPDRNQENSHSSNTIKGSSSKFRGVLWLKSGKWGARISFNYKPYWLGTYDLEEEAAKAYDRAAIKLQRSDAPLNFPMSMYSVEETKFQSQHSNEVILDMIKDKTYSSKYKHYLASQQLIEEFRRSNQTNQRRISYKMLFRKELTQTDVTHIKGLHIPKEYAVQCFPPLSGTRVTGDENENKSMELTFYDKHCRSWTFRYSYWKSTQTFVFTKGWRHFLKMNNLIPKDKVFFYRCEHEEDFGSTVFYMIDVLRSSSRADLREVNKVVVHGIEEDETDNEIKLFGVQIGKRCRKA